MIQSERKLKKAQVINFDIVNDITKSGFRNVRVSFQEAGYYEDWLVRSSVNVGKSISFDPKNMYKLKDLNEAEKQAIGYKKSEARLQNLVSSTSQKVNNDKNKGISTTGILSIIGVISAVLITGVLVVRKKLSKKVKKVSRLKD